MVRLPQALSAAPRGRWAFAAVLAAAALAFAPVLLNGFVWDDRTFLLDNPVLREAANVPALFTHPETWGTPFENPYYRPLTTLTFLTDTLLWGERPAGFHATNLLLHLGACALLLALLRRLLAPGPALAAALLFAVHPAHAEPVAYASARADLLCGLLLLASFLAWIRHAEEGARGALALSALAYGAALLAKISAGLFPAVFALHALLLARRRPRVRDLLPFAAVALAYLAAREAVLAVQTWPEAPLELRLATAGPLVARYALMALSPTHLRVFHDLSVLRPEFDATAVAAWTAIAALLATAAATARRAPRAALALAWFLAGVIPVSGLVTILHPTPAADRYLYLPLLGGSLAAGALVQRLAAARLPIPARRAAAGGFALAVLSLAAFSAARTRLWRDPVSLWERAAVEAPRHPYVLNSLGQVYKSLDRLDDAERVLQTSLAVAGANPEAHYFLAGCALRRNDLDRGARHAMLAIAQAPEYAPPYRRLARILMRTGNTVAAQRAAERALALDPYDESASVLLAEIRRSDGGPGMEVN